MLRAKKTVVKKERELTALEKHVLDKKAKTQEKIAEYIQLMNKLVEEKTKCAISDTISQEYIAAIDNLILFFKSQGYIVLASINEWEKRRIEALEVFNIQEAEKKKVIEEAEAAEAKEVEKAIEKKVTTKDDKVKKETKRSRSSVVPTNDTEPIK